jgi:hypothetical protein
MAGSLNREDPVETHSVFFILKGRVVLFLLRETKGER